MHLIINNYNVWFKKIIYTVLVNAKIIMNYNPYAWTTFTLTFGSPMTYLLNSLTGIIKLRRSPPPKLRGPQYVLNVTATDDNIAGGPLPLSSSAQVIVGINDINNNKPVFDDVSLTWWTIVLLRSWSFQAQKIYFTFVYKVAYLYECVTCSYDYMSF